MRRLYPVGILILLFSLLTACGPNQTQSVHLPLAVGNRWVYDVQADSVRDVATLEVVGEDGGAFALAARCTVGYWTAPRGPLYLTCRDSVLWLRDTTSGYWSRKAVWKSILSDDLRQVNTQTLLLFRGPGNSRFATRSIPEFRIGSDTYRNCLAVHNHNTYSASFWFLFFFGSHSDSAEVEEVYCPNVGLVSFSEEHHWQSSWGLLTGGGGGSDSGVCYDRWQLRSFSLNDR